MHSLKQKRDKFLGHFKRRHTSDSADSGRTRTASPTPEPTSSSSTKEQTHSPHSNRVSSSSGYVGGVSNKGHPSATSLVVPGAGTTISPVSQTSPSTQISPSNVVDVQGDGLKDERSSQAVNEKGNDLADLKPVADATKPLLLLNPIEETQVRFPASDFPFPSASQLQPPHLVAGGRATGAAVAAATAVRQAQSTNFSIFSLSHLFPFLPLTTFNTTTITVPPSPQISTNSRVVLFLTCPNFSYCRCSNKQFQPRFLSSQRQFQP